MISIQRVGLLNTPEVVLRDDVDMPDRSLCDGGPALVYGSHRVEALRRLGLRGAKFRLLVGDSSQVELIGLAEPVSCRNAWGRWLGEGNSLRVPTRSRRQASGAWRGSKSNRTSILL